MDNKIYIPNGDKEVSINLTVKEILSLVGDRFREDRDTLVEAKKKIRKQLDKI